MTDHLGQLQARLVDRLTAHPPTTWSAPLIEVVINAIDLQFGIPPTGDPAAAAALQSLTRNLTRPRESPSTPQPDQPKKLWLTRNEVAERLRISKSTLEGWVSEGKGPKFMKPGRHVRYRLGDVIAWEASQLGERQ